MEVSDGAAPWYIYIIGIAVVLPCYALWALGGFGLVRAVLSWVTTEPTQKGARQ
jgi:hypothetical protein